ncbi:MAG: hypothetical protein IPI67_17840 [Myxococcales bacterium]|nr:hypothetical protein [Myxococcales bacterium]
MADLLGLPVGDEYQGQSLVPEVFGAEARPRPVSSIYPAQSERPAQGDHRGDHKPIAFGDDRRFELFNVGLDFAERERYRSPSQRNSRR